MMKSPVIHVEVLGADGRALQQFYGETFGWDFAAPSAHAFGQMNYRIAFPKDGEGVAAGVGGDMPADVRPGVTFYVCVDDLDDTLAKVNALGGKVLRPPAQADENSLRVALIEDPDGNAIGLVDRASLK